MAASAMITGAACRVAGHERAHYVVDRTDEQRAIQTKEDGLPPGSGHQVGDGDGNPDERRTDHRNEEARPPSPPSSGDRRPVIQSRA
jgi:hypothetical protein